VNRNVLGTVRVVTRWFDRHRTALEADLAPGELLLDADRVQVTSLRRVPRVLPGRSFILGVTNRRIVVWNASTWLARPRSFATAWPFEEGVALSNAPLGRLHLLLPDRTIVTLRSYGSWSIRHLGRARL
jgi:hypothetical protein